jgi:hypothetical protein
MHRVILISVLLAIFTTAIYWQTGNQGFLGIDDPAYVTENIHVMYGLSARNIEWAFTSYAEGNWHPITWLSHMVDVQMFGLFPRGHHLTNVVIHTFSSLLLFLLLFRMTGAVWRSSFVAVMFALHPLHVESVAWIAERKDVLSAFFGFLTLLLYVEYTIKPSCLRYLLVFSSLIAGLMSKSMLVTLPILMFLIDVWPLQRNRSETSPHAQSIIALVKEKLPFFACSLCTGLIAIYTQKTAGAISDFAVTPVLFRIENAVLAYVTYLFKTICPSNLSLYYPLQFDIEPWKAIVALVLLILVSAVTVLKRQEYPFLVTGWLWFIITLLPVIGLIQVGAQAMADRYTYIPATGLFIIIAWGSPLLVRNFRFHKKLLVFLYCSTLATVMVLTCQQLRYWNDNVTLYRHALAITSDNYFIHYCLGEELQKNNDFDGAELEFQESIRINSQFKKAHNGLGLIRTSRGYFDAAIKEYQLALQIDPSYIHAGINIGIAFANKGDFDAAITEFQRVIQRFPDAAQAHFNLGLASSLKGNRDLALQEYREALRINPGYGRARLKLEELLGTH